MTRGYVVNNYNISRFCKEIAVYNYPFLNEVDNCQIVERNVSTEKLVGFWKIKNLKV